MTSKSFSTSPGVPLPFGASCVPDGVNFAIFSRHAESVSLVLEGVHIPPAFMEKLRTESDAVVIPIMLGVLKRKQLQRRIQGRSSTVPGRRAGRYLEHFDEIWRLQSYLLSEADQANIPIVTNTNRDKVFREIMRITIDTLAKQFASEPEAVLA